MICIKCKADLPDGALFCMLCGKKQTPEKRKHRKRANGTGTIYKMPGNRSKPWAAKRNNVFLGSYKTYAEAQKALERITDATITEKYNMTFTQVYEAWKPVQERKVTKSQMNCYATSYKNCPELHDLQFRKIRQSNFQNVIIRLEQSGKSKSTCEKMRHLFSQLSKWALAEEIIPSTLKPSQSNCPHGKYCCRQILKPSRSLRIGERISCLFFCPADAVPTNFLTFRW